jgi:hypothetical protein
MKLKAVAGAAVLAAGLLIIPVAATSASAAPIGNFTCTGTLQAPGTLSGTFANVTVVGACLTVAPTHVLGNVTVTPGALFGGSVTHAGSPLVVNGNVTVLHNGVAFLGCFATSQPCMDDNPNNPTLNGPVSIGGNLTALGALGIVNHDMTLGGNETVIGGGGGAGPDACNTTPGGFAIAQSPAFTDTEDSTVRGNLVITGLRTCWMGTLRVHVGGNVVDTGNTFADPDANEVNTNVVNGNMVCLGNSPAVQFGDSGGQPNRVRGNTVGECSFNTLQPNPAPNGPLEPISVRV